MFLKKIIDLRDEYEITQIKMSELIGVSKSTYGRWETDETIIPLVHLNDLCNYFKVSMDYMVGLSNKKHCGDINPKLNKKLIGLRLKEIRKENNYTQEKLADMLGTTHSTISSYENGKTRILTAFAYQIALKFNISIDYLCGRSNKKLLK